MSQAPPGWHPLPNNQSIIRYFDGQQWTQHYRHWDGTQWADGLPQQAPTPQPAAQQVTTAHNPFADTASTSQRRGLHTEVGAGVAQEQTPVKKSKKVWLIPAAAVTVLALAGGGLYFGMMRDDSPEAVAAAGGGDGNNAEFVATSANIEPIVNGDISDAVTSEIVFTDEERGLDYTRPIVDIEARDGEIRIRTTGDYGRGVRPDWVPNTPLDDRGGRSDWWIAEIYADPELTVQVGSSAFYDDATKTVRVVPDESAFGAVLSPDGEIIKSRDVKVRENVSLYYDEYTEQDEEDVVGKWGMRDTYYVVRYITNDGKMDQLERPVVAKISFTQSLPTPNVTTAKSTELTGTLEFNWQPVPGADHYGIFVSRLGWSTAAEGRTMTRIGETTETTWNPDLDGDAPNASVQNYGLRTGVPYGHWLEDDYDLGSEYAVIAYDESGEKMSAMASINANTESISALPYEVDFDNFDNLNFPAECVEADDCSFQDDSTGVVPYITVDGSYARAIGVAESIEKSEDGDWYWAVLRIEGTALYYRQGLGVDIVTEEAAKEALAQYSERVSGERLPTGDIEVYKETKIDEDAEVASGVDESVLSEIDGMNNELVTYIASHMYEGNTAISMIDYASFWGVTEIDHAAEVAEMQNPQFGVWSSFYDTYDATLYIEYNDPERAKQAREKVESVVADLGIADMSSDSAKVEAINDYIVANVEYNYAALDALDAGESVDDYRESWTLAGAVLDGNVVCAGYSMMFKAMADEAGLESVYVTGQVLGSASGHAWNKVKVDGEWKAVDTTWNDQGDTSSDKYLMINDSQFTDSAERYEDSDWLMGEKSSYATP